MNHPMVDSSWSWVVLAVCTLGNTLSGCAYVLFSLIYRDLVEEFGTTSAAVGWIGSIHIGCGDLLSIFYGMAVDKFGCRMVFIFASLLCALGFFLSFFATSVAYLCITHGLISGVGIGLITMVSYVNAMKHFERRRALAGVIVSLGYSMGAVLVGPIMRHLFEIYTWRDILVLFAGLTLQMIPAAAFAFRPWTIANPPKSEIIFLPVQHTRGHIKSLEHNNDDLTAVITNQRKETCPRNDIQFYPQTFRQIFSDPAFVCYLFGCSFMYGGVMACINHSPSRAYVIGIDKLSVNYLPFATDASTIVSKIIFACMANNTKINRTIFFSFAILCTGLCQMTVPLFRTLPLLLLHGCLVGFCTGFIFSLHVTIIVDLKGLVNVTRTQPLVFMCFGIASLFSTPLAGFLYDVTDDYDLTLVIVGLSVVVGSIWSFSTAWFQRRREQNLSMKQTQTNLFFLRNGIK